jgi:apolipoprotein N-acyltransferase
VIRRRTTRAQRLRASRRGGGALALRNIAVAAVAGWAINLAFPTANLWVAAPIGLALLWSALEHSGVRGGFGLGMVAGLGFFLPHLWFIDVSAGVVPWLALATAESLAIALPTAAWCWVRSRKVLEGKMWAEPIVFALLWVAGEQLRSIAPYGGFPWGRLAFSQIDAPVAALAWLGGAPLVSFAVATAGGALGLAFEAIRGRRLVLSTLAIGGAVAVYAAGLAIPLDTAPESGTLRVGLVQGNVPNLGLDSFRQARLVTQNHADETGRLVPDLPWTPDVVVWAEDSADVDPRVDATSRRIVTDAAVAVGAPILLGTNDYSPVDGRYNTALLWSPKGEAIAFYNKQHPVPFAEYLPLRTLARAVTKVADRLTVDMLPGDRVGLVSLPSERLGRDVPLGDVICFEVAYDPLIRSSVRAGAEIIVVQTNNATFGLTNESEQQFAMTRMRAIETGRAAVQVSTVGVSGFVLPDGSVVSKTGLFTAEHLTEEVPLRTSMTPAMRIGGVLGFCFLVAPVGLWLIRWLMSLRGRWDWD